MYLPLLGDYLFKRKKIQRIALLGVLFAASFLAWLLYRTVRFNNSITFLNVGEGDSILLVTQNGKSVLVDGGPSEEVLAGLGQVLPPLSNNIDVVIATHLHADHITGLLSVLLRYRVGLLLLPARQYDSPVAQGLTALANKRNIATRFIHRGDSIKVDDVNILTVWPDMTRDLSENINASALMFLVQSGVFRALLTSDVELGCNTATVLKEYVKEIGEVDVLKVPHQGSASSLCEDALMDLSPTIAVIPVGKNSYGHPAPNTLELLEALGVYIVRTDLDGNTTIWWKLGSRDWTMSHW